MSDVRDLSNRAVELAEDGQSDKALALVNKGIILFRMCRYQDAINFFFGWESRKFGRAK